MQACQLIELVPREGEREGGQGKSKQGLDGVGIWSPVSTHLARSPHSLKDSQAILKLDTKDRLSQ